MNYNNKEIICFEKNGIKIVKFKALLEFEDKINHLFTLRHGGNSKDDFFSLNLGLYTGDNKEIVKQNYINVCNTFDLNFEKLFLPKQIHSDKSIYIDNNNSGNLYKGVDIECDGAFTNNKQIPLVTNCADCITLLISISSFTKTCIVA